MLPMVISAVVRDLWAPDEPRYGEVAREVYENGSFLVMHLCGAVYPDKPPLLFWLSGLGGWMTGWSEWALRVPSLLATGLTAWMVVVLARRWWGEVEARWAPVIFLTLAMVTEVGGRLQIDPLLMVLCVGALVVGTTPTTDPRRRTWALLAAGLMVGLGALTKGPVAFINVGLVAVAWRLFAPSDEERVPVGRWVWPAVVFLAVAPALIWALAAAMAEPKLFEALFFDQHLGRVTKADRHPGPIWKHLERLPLMLLPWTLVVWYGIVASWRQWKDRAKSDVDLGLIRAALWLGVLVLFYSIIPPKRDIYLLSAYPAAALLAARALAQRIREGRLERWVGWVTAAIIGLIGITLSGMGLFLDQLQGLLWRGPAAGIPLLVAAAVALWAVGRKRPALWASSIVVGWLVFSVMAGLVFFPPLNSLKSSRGLAMELASRPEKPEEIPCFGRVKPGGFRFYGGIPTVPATEFLSHLQRDGQQFLGLANKKQWDKLSEEDRLPFAIAGERRVGGKTFVIVVADSRVDK
jgi:4-amino-4-deoxy-L-arabinose transferase